MENDHKTKYVAPSEQTFIISKHSHDCHQKPYFKMSCVMRKSAFYVCENKGPDQLSGNHTADHRLSFHYKDNTTTLLHEIPKFQTSSILYVCTALSLSVLVGYLKHRFSRDAAQISFKRSDDRLCCGLCQFHQTEAFGV